MCPLSVTFLCLAMDTLIHTHTHTQHTHTTHTHSTINIGSNNSTEQPIRLGREAGGRGGRGGRRGAKCKTSE